jgi:serine/threonine protein kinase
MLYEMLTLNVPFQGTTLVTLGKHLMEKPEPPRERAPERRISPILERTCLRALNKLPEERHPSVKALHDEVQDWLEEELDQGGLDDEFDARVAAADAALKAFLDQKQRTQDLRREEEGLLDALARAAGPEDLARLLELERLLDEEDRQLIVAQSEAEASIVEGLAIESDHPKARQQMLAYCRHAYRAETDPARRASLEALIERYREAGPRPPPSPPSPGESR